MAVVTAIQNIWIIYIWNSSYNSNFCRFFIGKVFPFRLCFKFTVTPSLSFQKNLCGRRRLGAALHLFMGRTTQYRMNSKYGNLIGLFPQKILLNENTTSGETFVFVETKFVQSPSLHGSDAFRERAERARSSVVRTGPQKPEPNTGQKRSGNQTQIPSYKWTFSFRETEMHRVYKYFCRNCSQKMVFKKSGWILSYWKWICNRIMFCTFSCYLDDLKSFSLAGCQWRWKQWISFNHVSTFVVHVLTLVVQAFVQLGYYRGLIGLLVKVSSLIFFLDKICRSIRDMQKFL